MDATSWGEAHVRRILQAPTSSDDKYSRGVVGLRTGSLAYPGAAVLGVEAAWRTGVGMVRYTGPASQLVLARRPETVCADGRVGAWVVGSGTDADERADAEREALLQILTGSTPVVIDAGALDLAAGAPAPIIVTPHARELERLRASLGMGSAPEDRVDAAVQTARALGGVVLSKGATTIVADPSGAARAVTAETSWLAAAGTGDVLAGIVGALAATLAEPHDLQALADAAASAAWLHSRAGMLAASGLGSAGGPITALDVAEALPRVVGQVLGGA